jgi:hypothetical protein
MRVLLKVRIPVEAGNAAIKAGAMAPGMRQFQETAKPEALYFTLADGARTMYAVVDMASSADMPRLLEPMFSMLNAEVEATPCMNADDLAAGLQAAGLA